MAWQPEQPTGQRRWLAPSRPNYNDFTGPADGDYVRYVEQLMAWSEAEQARLRLQAPGERQRSTLERTPDSQWGRSAGSQSVASAPAKTKAKSKSKAPDAVPPGSADTAVAHLQRQARLARQQLARVQQPAGAFGQAAHTPANGPALRASSWVLLVAALVAVGLFATAWLPAVIIVWVVFNLFRAVRAASGAGKP